jgi:hypothetical protein
MIALKINMVQLENLLLKLLLCNGRDSLTLPELAFRYSESEAESSESLSSPILLSNALDPRVYSSRSLLLHLVKS